MRPHLYRNYGSLACLAGVVTACIPSTFGYGLLLLLVALLSFRLADAEERVERLEARR